MSAGNKQAGAVQLADSELTDEQVREYLKRHDDFLQRNPDMLDYLHISHASGSAISLVEKQVSVLRERNIDMRQRLNALTGNARENDKLYEQTRELVLTLIEAESVGELANSFLQGIREAFDVDHACFLLYGEQGDYPACRTAAKEDVSSAVGGLIKTGKAVCGTLRAEEIRFLFPEGGEVGSAAVIPLTDNSEDLGVIAIGSTDAHRYSSNIGTLFLSHLADVIVRLLPRFEQH